MKKLICCLSILGMLMGTAFAQITISSQDMAHPGDTIRLNWAAPAQVSTPANTGTNYLWDYRQLTPDSTALHTFQDPNNPPSLLFRLAFLSATVMDEGEANGLLLFTGMDNVIYPFYETGSSGFDYLGYGAYINGQAVPLVFDQPDRVYPLPMTFGTTDQSLGSYELNVPNVAFYRQKILRDTDVDGWGVLQLPGGDYAVLRVFSTVTEQDSLYLDSLGFGFNLPAVTRREYKWLASGYPGPVLEIHEEMSFGGPGGGQFRPTYVAYREGQAAPLAREAMEGAERVKVYPNPAQGFVKVELPGKEPFWLRVLDAQGREVSRHAPQTQEWVLPTGQLAPGVYLLEMQTTSGFYTHKLVIR